MDQTSDAISEPVETEHKDRRHPVITRRVFRQMSAPERYPEDGETVSQYPNSGEKAAARQAEAVDKKRRRFQFLPAFWTIVSITSLVINIVLVVVLFSVFGQFFQLKNAINDQLITGLESNFALMDQARIKTTINVSTNVPAKFSLPLKTDSMVSLTQDTLIKNAKVSMLTGGLQITNAPATIILPAGTQLPIHLELSVPVDQQIPVALTVPVDIPLNQTDLHQPFSGLQNVVKPYRSLLATMPGSWRELICGTKPSDLCQVLVP